MKKVGITIRTKSKMKLGEVCAHLFLGLCYYNRRNPPIHYIVFATPHKTKYLLLKRPATPLAFLIILQTGRICGTGTEK